MTGRQGRMTGLVAQFQRTYYHMITVAVKEKLGILEVIEGEEDSPGREKLQQPTKNPRPQKPRAGHPAPKVVSGFKPGPPVLNARGKLCCDESSKRRFRGGL